MRIIIGCDHGAFELKEHLRKILLEMPEIQVEDAGIYEAESIDYPDMAQKVCQAVVKGEADKGILLCGTGIGISIAANKIKGIRAALCHDVFSARMSREHNDANVLAMGGRILGPCLAEEILRAWLEADFSQGERHARRIAKMMALEEN